MIDTSKQYTYNDTPVRIYADGSDTVGSIIHFAYLNDFNKWTSMSANESDLVEVWEPVVGELVWCWNTDYKMPNIRYYDKCTGSVYWMKDMCLRSDFWGYHYVSPFTGELPEAFKGLKDE